MWRKTSDAVLQPDGSKCFWWTPTRIPFLITMYIYTSMYMHTYIWWNTFVFVKTRISQNYACLDNCSLDFSILFPTLSFKNAIEEHLNWFHNTGYIKHCHRPYFSNYGKPYTYIYILEISQDQKKNILLLLIIMTANIYWVFTTYQTLKVKCLHIDYRMLVGKSVSLTFDRGLTVSKQQMPDRSPHPEGKC